MYAEDMQPIALEELDIRQFIPLQKSDNGPLVKVRSSLDTPHLKQDFDLDLIIWNLTEENLERTEKVVRYVLKNFNKLFETGWTVLYRYLCHDKYDHTKDHTVEEFFTEQIDFESSYYTIQLEINCGHLEDGQARYCFVVSTTCDYRKWMIADDNMRVYMIGNRACGFNDNNDDGQMRESLEDCAMFYGMGQMLAGDYEKMEAEGFQFAEPFEEEA